MGEKKSGEKYRKIFGRQSKMPKKIKSFRSDNKYRRLLKCSRQLSFRETIE